MVRVKLKELFERKLSIFLTIVLGYLVIFFLFSGKVPIDDNLLFKESGSGLNFVADVKSLRVQSIEYDLLSTEPIFLSSCWSTAANKTVSDISIEESVLLKGYESPLLDMQVDLVGGSLMDGSDLEAAYGKFFIGFFDRYGESASVNRRRHEEPGLRILMVNTATQETYKKLMYLQETRLFESLWGPVRLTVEVMGNRLVSEPQVETSSGVKETDERIVAYVLEYLRSRDLLDGYYLLTVSL